jgi:hypothetical protein
MFICTICAAEVSKPKSLAIDDKGGRACRTHTEAVEYRDGAKAAVAGYKKLEEQWATERVVRRDEMFQPVKNPNTFCWHCQCHGIPTQLFAERLLIGMHKLRLQGTTPNILMPSEEERVALREAMNIPVDIPVLKMYDVSHLADWQLRQLIKKSSIIQLIEMNILNKVANLCADCVDKFHIKEPEQKMPSISNMLILGALVEPILKDAAATELTAEYDALVKAAMAAEEGETHGA